MTWTRTPEDEPGAWRFPRKADANRWDVFVWTYRVNRHTLPWLARFVNAVIDALRWKRGQ